MERETAVKRLIEHGKGYVSEFNRWNSAYEAGKKEGTINEFCDEFRTDYAIKIEAITEIAVKVFDIEGKQFSQAIH